MRKLASVMLVTAFALSGVYACGGDDDEPTGTEDAGTRVDAADSGGGDSGQAETGGETETRCSSFEDETANEAVTISFPTDGVAAQYSPNCIRVKVGTVVTWEGLFSMHPLAPRLGSPNSPITETESGTSRTFEFTTAGTFGYECSFHPGTMFGAVQVVP